jgi:hypothetical protein
MHVINVSEYFDAMEKIYLEKVMKNIFRRLQENQV